MASGGQYEITKKGLRRVQKPTAPHPDGNAPRAATGARMDTPQTKTSAIAEKTEASDAKEL
ncbi:MAG: hypothetical protein AAF442_05425 [Pseudomonadota bacterium]